MAAVDFCRSPGHTPQFKRAAGCNIPEPPRNMPCSLVRQFSATPCTENATFGCLPGFKLCNLTVNVEKAAEVVRRVVRHVENVKP